MLLACLQYRVVSHSTMLWWHNVLHYNLLLYWDVNSQCINKCSNNITNNMEIWTCRAGTLYLTADRNTISWMKKRHTVLCLTLLRSPLERLCDSNMVETRQLSTVNTWTINRGVVLNAVHLFQVWWSPRFYFIKRFSFLSGKETNRYIIIIHSMEFCNGCQNKQIFCVIFHALYNTSNTFLLGRNMTLRMWKL